jgi:hypothetical protein
MPIILGRSLSCVACRIPQDNKLTHPGDRTLTPKLPVSGVDQKKRHPIALDLLKKAHHSKYADSGNSGYYS